MRRLQWSGAPLRAVAMDRPTSLVQASWSKPRRALSRSQSRSAIVERERNDGGGDVALHAVEHDPDLLRLVG